MPQDIFHQSTPAIAARRKKLAPGIHDAFATSSERVFAEGALPTKTKRLIAVAAHSALALDAIEELTGKQGA